MTLGAKVSHFRGEGLLGWGGRLEDPAVGALGSAGVLVGQCSVAVNFVQVVGVRRSVGPSGVLESRMAMVPGMLRATSRHSLEGVL